MCFVVLKLEVLVKLGHHGCLLPSMFHVVNDGVRAGKSRFALNMIPLCILPYYKAILVGDWL
jgi:hypothetical protein